MQILFVAKHGCGDNNDEDAVTYALTELGHTVICVHEMRKYRPDLDISSIDADLCLFFKWEGYDEIRSVAAKMPVVFWYFDMVASQDTTLRARVQFRRNWFDQVLPHCLLGFCTDGDWVNQDQTGKLRWLMQGADERFIGMGTPLEDTQAPILFTGMIKHGEKRAQHIHELRNRYGGQFNVLGDGGPNRRLHGRNLANLFASTKVVIAPDGPCTDNYWSNRIYLTLGLGGFLIHPFCKRLTDQFEHDELLLYHDHNHLVNLIDYYIADFNSRQEEINLWREIGLKVVTERHLYRHRCIELLCMVDEAL